MTTLREEWRYYRALPVQDQRRIARYLLLRFVVMPLLIFVVIWLIHTIRGA